MMVLLLCAMVAAAMWLARGEPPPDADPALGPFFHSLKRTVDGVEIGCCDKADCRPVMTRWRSDGSDDPILEVFIGPQFPNTVNDWRPVPVGAILHNVVNQVGQPIACWFNNEVRCFLDGGSS